MSKMRNQSTQSTTSYADTIGLDATDRMDLSEQVLQGLPFKSFVRLMKTMELTNRRLAELVQISERTLVRRRKEGRLKSDESERLLRFSRLFGMALDLFDGDRAAAQEWLSSPARALKGKAPLEASKTEVGAREVEDLITRLEHGVFA